MKVGFLGFGEVASTLSDGLIRNGVDVCTCVEGRNSRTRDLANKVGVNRCKTNREVAEISEIIVSAVVPSSAVEVAKEVGEHFNGVYVDVNNISPPRVKEALGFIKNGKTVDASLIGSVKKGLDVKIIASGRGAERFAKLNGYGMNIKVIGPEVGQASAIKMLRSAYTKGVSALLFETLYAAYKMGVDEMLLECISETECPGFKESAMSRIISSTFHAERRAQEMMEVVKVVSEHTNPMMSRATSEFFKLLSNKEGKHEKKLENYRDVFYSFYED